MPPPDTVTVVSPSGETSEVAREDLAKAAAQGYRIEQADEHSERLTGDVNHEVYGGLAGGVLAFGANALSGATLGMSDAALAGLGAGRDLRGLRHENPHLAMAGQVVGAIAPALVAPESLLGRSPAGFLARGAAEAAEGAKALGGVRAVAGVAAATGAEAAIQNAGMYLSDVALGDRDLTAEGLAGALGHGFAFGSVAGGATLGIEKGTIAARKMFSRVAEGGAEATTAAETAWTRKSEDVLSAGEETAAIAKKRLAEIRMAKEEASLVKAKSQAELAQAKLEAFRGRAPAATEGEGAAAGAGSAPEAAVPPPAEVPPSAPIAEPAAPAPAAAPAPDTLPAPAAVPVAADTAALPAAPDATTPLERQLQAMKSQVDSGKSLQELNAARVAKPAEVLGPDLAAEEQKLTEAVKGFEDRKAAVDAWIQKYKNPRIRTEADWSPGAGRSGGMPVVRSRMNTPLAEDVIVEQSGGRMRVLGEGADKLESVTPNTRILAASNHADYEAGAQLDEAYADAVHRAHLAETPALRQAALEEAAGFEKQSHAFLRDHSPQNKAVIDRIEQVRKEAGTTGYHAAEARAEKLAARDAAAKPGRRYGVDPETEAEYQATLSGRGPRGPVDASWMAKYDTAAKPGSFVEEAHEATEVIGAYEKANADLVDAIGDAAPQSAKEAAAAYRQAEATAERKQLQRSARAVDDSRAEAAANPKASYGPDNAPKAASAPTSGSAPASEPAPTAPGAKPPKQGSGPLYTEEQRRRLAEIKLQGAEHDLAAKKATSEAKIAKLREPAAVNEPADAAGNAPAEGSGAPVAPPSGGAGLFDHAKNAASLVELVGGIPGMPKPSDLPVVGPLLGLYLKFRALKSLAGKMGGRIGASGDAKAAALASKTRDAVAQSVDRMLGLAIKAAPAVRTVGAVAAAKVADVLDQRLFDDGRPQPPKNASAGELAAARAFEVRAAASNPEALLAQVRKQMRDVADPDLIAAAEQQQLRKFQYLASVAPMPPPPDPLGSAKWTPNPADTSRFAHCIEVANDPVAALHQVELARLTPEGAQTLRAVYPQLFADAQARLLRRIPELEGAATIPYAQRCRMSLLFDVPLTRSLAPEAIASLQAAHADRAPIAAPPAAAPPMPSLASAPDLTSMVMPASDRRASRR